MNKAERKRLRREMERKAEKEAALSATRSIHDDIRYWGVGRRVMQIIYQPSFETNKIWDIREQDGQLVLFEAEADPQTPKTINPGYFRLDISHGRLQQFLQRFSTIRVPVLLSRSNMGGADGTTFIVEFFGTMESIRISWWEDPFPGWEVGCKLTKEAVELFLGLESLDDETQEAV